MLGKPIIGIAPVCPIARMDRFFRDDTDFDALLTQLVERTIAAALQSFANRDQLGEVNRAVYRDRGSDGI